MVSPPRKTEMTLSLALCLRVSHFTPRDQPQTTPSSLQERKCDCATRSSDHSVIQVQVRVVSRDAPLQLGVYVLLHNKNRITRSPLYFSRINAIPLPLLETYRSLSATFLVLADLHCTLTLML